MTIQQLKLSNFQTYKKAKINFSSGFNAIIGSTDSGKSRIAKAIKWTAQNKPRTIKVSPRSNPDVLTTSTIKVDDNIVRKIKGKGVNKYVLIDKNKKKKTFKSFKSKVPDDIEQILNMSSLNFQNQHDSPFLLSKSSGERSRYLNKTVDLEIIDRSQKNISARIQKEHSKLSLHKQKIKDIRKQLKDFIWLPDAEDQLRKIEIENRKISHIENQIEGISTITSTIRNNKKQIKKLKKITKYKKEIEKLVEDEKTIEHKEEEIEKLETLLENISAVKNDIIIYKERKKKLQKKLNRIMRGRCPLCKSKLRRK